MVVLGDDKAWLTEIREAVRERLAGERLRLHPRKAHISRTRDGLDLLGYLVYPDFRLLRNDNGHRFARRLRWFAREYAAGRKGWKDFDPVVQSWIGHARHADTGGLRRRIFSATIFTRGWAERRPARDPGRFLEPRTEERALGEPEQERDRQPEPQPGVTPRPVRPRSLRASPGAGPFPDGPGVVRGCP
jgi:hypothetical protein